MECKNCQNQLTTNQKFCPECGGKVIVNRITFKTISAEILDKFFNIDNKFYQTFLTLLKQPQEVINGYVEGKRVKYFNPISYFAFALTLSGLYFYLIQKGFIDYSKMMEATVASYDNETQKEMALKINSYIAEYSNVMAVLFIPVYVLFSKILFSKCKDYNWAEHFIINIYLYSEATIITTIVLLFSAINSKLIVTINMLMFLFQMFYFAYAFKKIFGLSRKTLLLRTLFFILLIVGFFALLFIISIAIGILMELK
ncbi:DUF3667 domain-containing protein [Flavobacterium jejuense]|uniref:DUF3667 domain-containing protein n=1 Tax=Flavobacterium jejuense TaxID=1544455 RepID=A0ABX0ITY9_9FLAO|nr:DUF3667 domain-containing protein [Flavobacterium jejuense]NHN25993.1 DUF3667 domain-containing protein [Flavobacterium jejuense]